MARDNYAPRLFLRIGDRLAFSNGIIALAAAAAIAYAAFHGHTEALIPLYAVGVFLAFTLSQTGMVVHWWRRRGVHWRKSIAFNGLGALLSALVGLTAGVTKFTEGAWVILISIPLLLGDVSADPPLLRHGTKSRRPPPAARRDQQTHHPGWRGKRRNPGGDLAPHHRPSFSTSLGQSPRARLRRLVHSADLCCAPRARRRRSRTVPL
jgi:hypothetical protein